MLNIARPFALPLVLPSALLGIALSSCAIAQDDGEASAPRQTFAYQSSEGDGKSVELRVENGRVTVAKINGKAIDAARVKKVPGGYDILGDDGSVMRHVAVVQSGEMRAEIGAQRGGPVGSSSSSSFGSSSSSSSSGTNLRPRSESRAGGTVRGNARAEGSTSGSASSEQDGQRSGARSRARILIAPDREGRTVEGFPLDPMQAAVAMDEGPAPKSMIGAGLGAPDEAIAHHLKIDRRKSTMVTSVIEGLPAQAAGIERFDVIVSVNGDGDASSEHIRKVLREAEPGSKIALEILRGSDRRKVEVTAVEFDGEQLAQLDDAIEVEGFDMESGGMVPGMGPGMVQGMGPGMDGNGVMFFIGPDGQRRELRLPAIPNIPPMQQGFDPAQMEQFERAMGDMNRRMEEWARQMERRARDQGAGADGETEAGPGPQAVPPRRGPGDNNGSDERMRRLEERLDQLMRELERERADRRERKKDA